MLTVYIHVLASTHIPFHKLQSLSLLNALHIQRYWRALSSNTHVPPFLHVALPQGWGSTYSCCQRKHRNSFVKFHRKISRSHFELIAYFTARVQKKKKKMELVFAFCDRFCDVTTREKMVCAIFAVHRTFLRQRT